MIPSARKTTLLTLLIGASVTAQAELRFNGFFSAVGGFVDTDDRSYQGYEDDWTFDQDTRFGLQASADVADKLSVTGQIVARGADDYDAQFEWAYVSYAATDNLTLRGGRFRTPYYIYSDFIDVGYAYHWITPPSQVYSLPFNNSDGIDVVYRLNTGPIDHLFQAYVGALNDDFEQAGTEIDTELRGSYGLVWAGTLDGWLTLRASYHTSEVSLTNFSDVVIDPDTDTTIGDLASTLEGFGFDDNAAQLSVDEVDFEFSEIGAKAELGQLLLVAEYTELEADSGPIGDQKRWYASAAYTIDQVQLHVTYAEANDDAADLSSGIPVIVPTEPLIAALDGIAGSFAEENESITVGVRYDFMPSAALKAEWTTVDDENEEDVDLIRVAIDVVF